MNRRRHRVQRGFTLVEVMVALVVMAVLSTMAWQGIDAMVRSRDVNRDVVERNLRLSAVIGQWEQDMANFHSTSPGPTKSRVIDRPISFDGTAMRLVRRTDDGLQLVVWALRDGVLQRWASPVVVGASQLQDQWLRSLQLIGNEAQQVRTIESLQSMQVYFYAENAWSNAQSSLGNETAATGAQPSTPGAAPAPVAAPRLPQGVRVVLTLSQGNDGAGVSLTRDVALTREP